MARPEPVGDPLDRLISQSEEALHRIENLKKGQTGQSAGQRVVAHLTKHGSHLINLALAGCVFVVAYGQVTLKRKHEVLVVLNLCSALPRSSTCRLQSIYQVPPFSERSYASSHQSVPVPQAELLAVEEALQRCREAHARCRVAFVYVCLTVNIQCRHHAAFDAKSSAGRG